MTQERAVVRYADQVAREMAREFAAAPLDELRMWVRLAHQREAMVTELYRRSHVDQRLGQLLLHEGPCAVVRTALLNISAHEEAHTRLLSTVRGSTVAQLSELQGRIEGRVIRALTSGSFLARALIALGASVDRVPEFATQLDRMSLRELIQFQGELETTARNGYQRILQLLQQLAGQPETEREYGYTFIYDITRILCEECFHEEAFVAMSSWLSAEGDTFAAISERDCALVLHDLAERNLSLGAARRLFAPTRPQPKGPEEPGWVSDGGLGQWFRERGLAVQLASSEQLSVQLGA